MPRHRRPDTPANPHHLISRFMNRARRINSAEDRAEYLDGLGRASRRCIAPLLGYCAMSTHSHVLSPGDARAVGQTVHRANTSYGAWWNKTHGGFGRVFAERPRSIVVCSEEHLARVVAYVHNNPVRAGLVACPSDSDWSSHRAYIGEADAPPWLDAAWVLAEVGFSSAPSGRAAFHDYVMSRAHLPRDPTLAGPGPVSPSAFANLVVVIAGRIGIDPATVVRPGRDERAGAARLRVLRIAQQVFGMSASDVARGAGLSRAMLSKLKREVAEAAAIPRAELESIVEELLWLEQGRYAPLALDEVG